MTAPQRWAAVATAITALATALPAAAQADTSPTTTPPVPPVATCSTPAPPPSSGDGSSSGDTSSTGDTSSSGSSGTTTPGTDQTTIEPVPCIDAAGNVYILYVITTTTTTTPINAPIITANGPITWVSGNPVTETGGATTTTTTSPAYLFSSGGGAFSCTPIAGTSSMVCSLDPSESTSTAAASGGELELKCTLAQSARGKTTASKAKGTGKGKGKGKNKAKGQAATKAGTKAVSTAKRTAKKAKPVFSMLCSSA